ncbi:amino acid adenylation domain-containing protein [Amycolatopsis samaneae]|uniref:Amino acid adenylation domain-containing protein n=1 Tax=Amycolatopsis samaneae TaxID=664691 RepID=A0ABW5GP45_9PSEU
MRNLATLVADQTARTPHAVAVAEGNRSLTYAELGRESGRLARTLAGRGAGPETFVGICAERGIELAVALLAIWRVGSAYVPLDPGHPPARLQALAGRIGLKLVLSSRSVADAVRSALHGTGTEVLRLSPSGQEERDEAAPGIELSGSDAAYALFTSGSTGTPKAVVIDQAGIANRVLWTVRKHGLGASDRVLHKTALVFDAACWEIFAPLVSGGTVVMAPPGAEADPALLAATAAAERVTVLQVVPSVLRLLVAEPEFARCEGLRLVFSAGEPLRAELCAEVFARLDVELWNTYGPTECSIDVTAQRVDPAGLADPVPIGRPIDNTRILVLDTCGAPVPVGVAGELCVGGVGLARGYHGRAADTAAAFVPDPYGPAGARLYRTGDRARWRADGVLEYLGRLDQQVKINGVRVEPAEVESALTAHPAVAAAVVAGRRSADGAARLAAYFVSDGHPPEPEALRRYLAELLPSAFVPSAFVRLDRFPLTVSGKVDRRALPDPAPDTGRAPYVAPRNEVEQVVADVWADLLGVDGVGVHDDFFVLGGSSLMLTRLANRLRAAAGDRTVLRGLFSATTVEAQAGLLAAHDGPDAAVRPVPRNGPLPLSSGQERLWFADRLSPGGVDWIVPVLIKLPPDAGEGLVADALGKLASRHEILRTRYVTESGVPRQVIDGAGPVPLGVTGADLRTVLREQLSTGFDLTTGPVWRATLVRAAGEPDVLVLAVHHIAIDGWSSVVLRADLLEFCRATLDGREPKVADLPVQYADFAAWQREAAIPDEQVTYWREHLAGLPRLELPTDRLRPPVRDGRGAAIAFTLPPGLTASVLELGRGHGATPFMTFLTAFCVVLARHSGQWDLAVGIPVAGRNRPETEGVAGFFLNALALRCRLGGDLTFGAAVERVREVCLAGFARQEVPFERLVAELEPDRDLSRTPLYQVMFDLADDGVTSLAADSLDAEVFQRVWRTAKTDLTLAVRLLPDGSLSGFLEYATALFDRDTAEAFAAHLGQLVAGVVADPDTALSRVDILTARERAVLVPSARSAGIVEDTVLGAFEARARARPDAVALVCAGRSLTYRELDHRVTALAGGLRRAGAGPESVVGIVLDRSADLVAGMLAVWRAGAAYLPIDPQIPEERTGLLLSDARVDVVLTSAAHQGRTGRREVLTTAPDLPGVGNDGGWPHPGDLGYVVHTSGSTGRPKGVAVEHRALLNILLAKGAEVGFGQESAYLAVAPVSFDIAAMELFLPLISGGRVVVATEAEVANRAAQLRLLDRHGVTHLGGSPAHWRLLLDAGFGRRRDLVGLTGGESPSPAFARELRSRLNRLVHMYGPAESTISATRSAVEPDTETVHIGHALPNVTVVVLDEELRPVPFGTAGEICVGGVGLARGYFGRPALTAARFVPDPYGGSGARLYRTGDLGRMLPSGELDFLGRDDEQVKIRGYRVELGEIRAALARHPAVREAVVAVRENDRAGKQLFAYCVTDLEPLDGADELRTHCARLLPDYMVPVAVVPLTALPLTRHGKIDHAALAALDVPRRHGDEGPVSPRTELEERVAGLWREVLPALGGVHDNFFLQGGDSMAAARLVAMTQEEFDVEIPLRTVFDEPTVAGLAQAVERAVRAEIEALSDAEVTARALRWKESGE